MILGIFSDAHANLAALKATLSDMDNRHVEKIICLGDIMELGPDNDGALELVFKRSDIILPGNHDLLQIARINGDHPEKIDLTEDNRNRIEELLGVSFVHHEDSPKGTVLFTHSNPTVPCNMGIYVKSLRDAWDQITGDAKVIFVGHAHLPQIYYLKRELDKSYMFYDSRIKSRKSPHESFTVEFSVKKGYRLFVVVPSVGRPKDHMTQTGYALYDTETGTGHIIRLPYNMDEEVKRMRHRNFSESNIDSLKQGE